jgi:Tfp pilus tip-associated adhesin PilY1
VLYVADAQGKLWLFDIGDPERPKPYTHALIDGEVQGISVAADDPRADVWVAAGSGGLLRFAWLVSALP